MILKLIPPSDEDTATYHLPEPNMAVDPRPNTNDRGCSNAVPFHPDLSFMHIDCKGIFNRNDEEEKNVIFEVKVDGTSMTVTRINRPEDQQPGWIGMLTFRVYKNNEFRFSFTSTKYLFHGLEDEHPPIDATEVIVKDGVETITEFAFKFCLSLTKVTLPNTVTRIEDDAFFGCESLQYIQLPPNLHYIGKGAFHTCSSLRALYIPPTMTEFGFMAIANCESLRIINVRNQTWLSRSPTYTINHRTRTVTEDRTDFICVACYSILTDSMAKASKKEQIQWLQHRYNPLHHLCCNPAVSAQEIKQYIQQHQDKEEIAKTDDKPELTALHLLAANPSLKGDMITTYLKLAPGVAVMQDNLGMTPLHLLCSLPYFSGDTGGAIKAYLDCSVGKNAAFMMDYKGKTPFDYLCEKRFDELLFLEKNKTFAGLVVWWYGCLELGIEAIEGRKNREERLLPKILLLLKTQLVGFRHGILNRGR